MARRRLGHHEECQFWRLLGRLWFVACGVATATTVFTPTDVAERFLHPFILSMSTFFAASVILLHPTGRLTRLSDTTRTLLFLAVAYGGGIVFWLTSWGGIVDSIPSFWVRMTLFGVVLLWLIGILSFGVFLRQPLGLLRRLDPIGDSDRPVRSDL